MTDPLDVQVHQAIGPLLTERGFRVVWRRGFFSKFWYGDQVEWSDGQLSILATQEQDRGFGLNVGRSGARYMRTSLVEAVCYCMGLSKTRFVPATELTEWLLGNWERIAALINSDDPSVFASFESWLKSNWDD